MDSQKLFSNLELRGDTLQHCPGSLLSGVSLVAGTTIGAGILALPSATLSAGLLPSTLLMVGVWLYMVISGLLIAEVNLQTMQQLGKPYMGFMGTVQHYLGRSGFAIASVLYVFNHYALLVAYTARGGDILAAAVGYLFSVPLWWGHIVFIAVLGSVLFWASQQFVGLLNSGLLAVVLVSFLGLLALSAPQVRVEQWAVRHWDQLSVAIPVMFVAFVYHNVVPVITTQLEGDRIKVSGSIILGSLIPLVLFLIWNAVILGSIEPVIEPGIGPVIEPVTNAVDPIEMLRSSTYHPRLGIAISIFSEFAIITSFIGFVYGLLSFFEDLSFFADLSQEATHQRTKKKIAIYGLVLLPPIIPSILNSNIFFEAIELSGAFGISVLFGIIPAVMAWKQRYQGIKPTLSYPMVFGGKGMLVLVIGLATAVFTEHFLIVTGLL